jgi:DNA-binding transcriptional ArsR family regulator
MSKKTSSLATANISQDASSPDQTGFVTADKLTDLLPESQDLSQKEDNSVTREDKSYLTFNVQPSRGRHTTPPIPSNTPTPLTKPQNTHKKNQTTANNREQPRTTTPPKISRLSVVDDLKSKLSLLQIAKKYGVTESAVGYHIKKLKEQGVIRLVGYGTWEILKSPESEKKTTANLLYVGKKQPREEIQKNIFEYIPESVRGHAFMWTVEVPKNMRNWSNDKRIQYLDRHNIAYTSLGIFGGGQRLMISGHKVWLTNKSLVFYDTASYFAETAIAAKSTAVHSLLSLIRNLERLLHADFTIGDSWKFKPSRHHYAIIKNALAKQYDDDGLKLEVRTADDNSLWMWIDNSYNLNETEFGHRDTAVSDTSAMQDFCNSVRDTEETMYSIRDLKELQATTTKTIAQVVGSQMAMAANTDSHLGLISQIDTGIKDLSVGLQTFNSLLEKLFEVLGANRP